MSSPTDPEAGGASTAAEAGQIGRHVVVVGLMGCGKSTLGRLLAARLGWMLADSDVDIEAATGRTVRQLAAELGTVAMHDLEAHQLLTALAASTPSVVAAAASTVDRADCRTALVATDVDVVWLDVPVAVLAERFAAGAHRPDFGRPVADLLAEQQARRAPLFRSVADVVVTGGDDTQPGVLVERIVGLLRRTH